MFPFRAAALGRWRGRLMVVSGEFARCPWSYERPLRPTSRIPGMARRRLPQWRGGA